jgi:hypothetical protein
MRQSLVRGGIVRALLRPPQRPATTDRTSRSNCELNQCLSLVQSSDIRTLLSDVAVLTQFKPLGQIPVATKDDGRAS